VQRPRHRSSGTWRLQISGSCGHVGMVWWLRHANVLGICGSLV
jgi:hypothetical protein